MQAGKKRKLEKAGWKTGSVDEFLELTPEESAYIEMKLALCNRVKQARKQKCLSQVAFAKKISSSQSRVAKMESGDPSVSIDMIIKSLLALGATPKDVARAIAEK